MIESSTSPLGKELSWTDFDQPLKPSMNQFLETLLRDIPPGAKPPRDDAFSAKVFPSFCHAALSLLFSEEERTTFMVEQGDDKVYLSLYKTGYGPCVCIRTGDGTIVFNTLTGQLMSTADFRREFHAHYDVQFPKAK